MQICLPYSYNLYIEYKSLTKDLSVTSVFVYSMQHVEITDSGWSMLESKCAEKANAMGSVQGSIEGGGGNFAGFAGEVLFVEVFGGEWSPTPNYDVVMDDGTTVDVKTKRRWSKPEPYYDCSVADYNTEQDCDIYYFVSINKDFNDAYMLGYLPHDEYYDTATFREEGEVDPDNNFTFKADCWNVKISELDRFDTDIGGTFQLTD